jgi:hypothetical protein
LIVRRLWLIAPLFLLLWPALAGCGQAAPRSFAIGRDVIYVDNFVIGETGPWHTEADELGRTAVRDGRLLIEVDAANIMQFATLREPIFSDFTLEVDATLLEGPLDTTYGVLFRMQNPSQFYRYEVTGDGLYMIERRNSDGSWSRLSQDWVESPAIRQGVGVTNRLQIVAVGTNFAFYVNDVLLKQVQDTSYSQGNLALDAGTFGQPGARVAFTNLIVRRP